MSQEGKIDYIEFPVKNITISKKFFAELFNWQYQDYGPEYCAFFNAGINGGFFTSSLHSSTTNGSLLLIFYSQDLEAMEDKITKAGGTIIKPIFSFPGGRRLHFADPSGNEFAIWSDQEID